MRHEQRHLEDRISMLETASMARSDDDDASLAYMSVTHSPSDASSVTANYLPKSEGRDGGQRNPSVVSLRSTREDAMHHNRSVNVWDRGALGVVVNFAAVGAVHGVFQSFTYPFLAIYLNMDEYQAYAAERWMALPWMFKLTFAILSDAVPVNGGHHRKPYMYAGWTWCLLWSLLLVVVPSPAPYFENDRVVNDDAASNGGGYTAIFTLATIGYVLVDTVCDAWMVQLAHHTQEGHSEPTRASIEKIEEGEAHEDYRSQGFVAVVATLQAAKCFGQMTTTFLLALLCNSDVYGGSFAWSLSVHGVMFFSVLLCGGAIASMWYFLVEDTTLNASKSHSLELLASLRATVSHLWQFIHSHTVWRCIVAIFLLRVALSYYATSTKALYAFWTDISPLMSNLFSAIHAGAYGGIALLLLKFFQKSTTAGRYPFRWISTSSRRYLLSLAIGVATAILFISNVIFTLIPGLRSGFLALPIEQVISACDAIAYFVVVFVVVELADPKIACSSYALVMTFANVATPFAVSLAQSIGAHFDVYDDEYRGSGSAHLRKQMLLCVVMLVVVRLVFGFAGIMVLPHDGLHAKHAEVACITYNKLSNTQRRVVDGLGVVMASGLLLWAALMTLLASFETTSCLTVAGGEGC
uniref:Transmembrane protein n=1 Tax=Globisporangium ultimum (strain ATCC 200006 / CBS 805.95 / DAOM BR144) TaxID=431595 RepID=K3XBR0_GLOUD